MKKINAYAVRLIKFDGGGGFHTCPGRILQVLSYTYNVSERAYYATCLVDYTDAEKDGE